MARRHLRLSPFLYMAVSILVGVIVAYSAGIRFTLTPSMPIGLYRLVFSGPHPRSFDSRYFGPVPRGRILSTMRPLWTLD